MNTDFRIGQGYDVHELTPGRKLILGGVEIPHSRGKARRVIDRRPGE